MITANARFDALSFSLRSSLLDLIDAYFRASKKFVLPHPFYSNSIDAANQTCSSDERVLTNFIQRTNSYKHMHSICICKNSFVSIAVGVIALYNRHIENFSDQILHDQIFGRIGETSGK